MARQEIKTTVEVVGEPGKAEIKAFVRAIVPLLKRDAEMIAAYCEKNKEDFEAFKVKRAAWLAEMEAERKT